MSDRKGPCRVVNRPDGGDRHTQIVVQDNVCVGFVRIEDALAYGRPDAMVPRTKPTHDAAHSETATTLPESEQP